MLQTRTEAWERALPEPRSSCVSCRRSSWAPRGVSPCYRGAPGSPSGYHRCGLRSVFVPLCAVPRSSPRSPLSVQASWSECDIVTILRGPARFGEGAPPVQAGGTISTGDWGRGVAVETHSMVLTVWTVCQGDEGSGGLPRGWAQAGQAVTHAPPPVLCVYSSVRWCLAVSSLEPGG